MAFENIPIAGGDTGQPLTMRKRLRIIERHLGKPPCDFLDCGCGAGDYVRALTELYGIDAHGIEYELSKVEEAALKPGLEDRVSQGDLEKIQSESAKWDGALLNEVLEHVPDQEQGLREVHRVLKPGGKLIVFSPNRWFPFETHGVLSKTTGKKLPVWLPFIPYLPIPLGSRFFTYWARNYWQQELADLIQAAGFDIIERDFIWQTFENISGKQPILIKIARPMLRTLANIGEKTPFVRRFGVSQVIVARKPAA